MGKSSKGKCAAPPRHSGKKKNVRLWQGLFTLVVLGGLTWTYVVLYRPASQDSPSRPENPSDSSVPSDEASLRNRLVLPATPRNPRPPTLDPSFFPDPQVAAAYQIARAVPEVLESLPCYCGCYQSVGHRNNLDCFVDDHGVNCPMCQQIALEADYQHRQGTPIQQIKQAIDSRWAPQAR